MMPRLMERERERESVCVEESRVKLTENKLILDQFYFILPPYPSIQTNPELVLEPGSPSFPRGTGAMLSKVKLVFKSNSRAQ